MPKICDVMQSVAELRPHSFGDDRLLRWLNLLEGKIAADVFLMSIGDIQNLKYRLPEDMETELLVNHPHDDIYEYWLMAQIDMANGEFDRYQNSMAMYNAALDSFTAWFAQTYEPAQGYITEEL